MYRNKTISIVIPCYNEEKAIAYVVSGIPSYIDQVIVVDNDSKDKTAAYAKNCGAEVVFEHRRGYGRAYKKGLRQAKCEIVITIDGDGTYSFSEITKMLDCLIDNGFDFVIGNRLTLLHKKNMKKLNYIGNLILSFFVRALFSCNLKDSQSGTWVAKNAILKDLKLISDGMSLSEEIKIRAMSRPFVRCIEIPIKYRRRLGKSKLNVWFDGIKNLLFLFRLKFDI